jgi:hypothetical protein
MVKNTFKKLGLPLWSHLTVTGKFNLSMMLKVEVLKMNAPMDL